jgi:hypothetical protein
MSTGETTPATEAAPAAAAAGTTANAFALNAVAAGIAQELATFGGVSDDLVVAVAWRTEESARLLVADIIVGLEEFWAGDREGTKQRIVALARERIAGAVAGAVGNFVPADYEYVH